MLGMAFWEWHFGGDVVRNPATSKTSAGSKQLQIESGSIQGLVVR